MAQEATDKHPKSPDEVHSWIMVTAGVLAENIRDGHTPADPMDPRDIWEYMVGLFWGEENAWEFLKEKIKTEPDPCPTFIMNKVCNCCGRSTAQYSIVYDPQRGSYYKVRNGGG